MFSVLKSFAQLSNFLSEATKSTSWTLRTGQLKNKRCVFLHRGAKGKLSDIYSRGQRPRGNFFICCERQGKLEIAAGRDTYFCCFEERCEGGNIYVLQMFSMTFSRDMSSTECARLRERLVMHVFNQDDVKNVIKRQKVKSGKLQVIYLLPLPHGSIVMLISPTQDFPHQCYDH